MAIEIIYTIEDKSGTKGTTSVRVAGEPTLAGLTGFAVGWATALNNLIFGKILGATAHILANISGLSGNTAIVISDVEHLGKFQFATATGIRVDCNIPAINEAVVGTSTPDEIDVAVPQVADFITAMEDGISVSGALIQPCDVGEESLVNLIFAREGARNSGARR
jgi:hypothetical protein